MTMVHMKRPRRKDGGQDIAAPVPGSQPEYSYGLVIRMENFELDQLNVKQLPRVGQEVTVSAKAKVIRVAESSSSANKGDRNVELQITHLELHGVGGTVNKRDETSGGKANVGQVGNSAKQANVGAVKAADQKANVGRAGKTDSAFAQ